MPDATVNVAVDLDTRAKQNKAKIAAFAKGISDVKVGVDADTGAATAKLTGFKARWERFTAHVKVDADTSSAGRSLSDLGEKVNGFVALGGLIAPAFLPALGAVTAAAGGLAAAFAGAGAGLAALVAVALPGLVKISEAVKASDLAQKSLATSAGTSSRQQVQAFFAAQQAAQRVADARQRSAEQIIAAERAVQRATEDLTAARAEAQRQLEDLIESESDLALSEERARINLARAEERAAEAAQDDFLSDLEQREVALDLAEAQDALADVLRDRRRTADELADADRRGVNGSQQVLDATDRLRDAQENLTKAQTDGARAIADALAAQAQQAQLANMQAENGVAGVRNLAFALGELSPQQRKVYDRFIDLRAGFEGWAQSLEPSVLPLFITGMDLIEAQLPRLTPLVQASAAAFGNLLDRAGRALKSPFWTEFFAFLARTAGPAIRDFGLILGNLAAGFAGVLMAFEPLSTRMTGGLVDMTDRFAEWGKNLGDSEGFHRFVDYVNRTWPPLKETLLAIGSAFVHIVASLVGLGDGAVLGAIKGIADFIARMNPQDIRDMASSFVLFSVALKAIGLATAAASLGPWGLAIVAIGAAFVLAYRKVKPFREAVQKLVDWFKSEALPKLQAFADGVARFFEEKIQPVLEDFGAWFQREVMPVIEWLADTAVRKVGELVDFVVRNWPRIQDAIGGVIGFLKALWDNVLFPILDHLVIFLRDDIGPAWLWLWHHVVYPAITGIANIISWAWREVIKPVFEGAKTGIGELVDKFIWMKDRIGDAFNAVKRLASDIWGRITDIIRGQVNIVIRIINAIGDAIEWVADKIGLTINIPDIPLLSQSSAGGGGTPAPAHVSAGGGGGVQLATGGFITNGPRAIVGEGNPAFPEYVIPTDPKFRNRALGLFEMLGSHLMARGGVVPRLQDGGALGAAGAALTGGLVGGLAFSVGDAISKIRDAASGIRDLGQKVFGLPSKALTWLKNEAIDWAKNNVRDFVGSIVTGTIDPAALGLTGNRAANRKLGRKLNAARGWDGFWPALDALVMSESGWNNFAQNPTSTAYGIGQFLNSTWAGVGYSKTSDPRTQILAMLDYIAQRYSNPSRAWAFKQAHNYYAVGGILPGYGPMSVIAHGGEVILNGRQQQNLLDLASTSAYRSDTALPADTTINVEAGAIVINVPPGADGARAGRAAAKAFLKTIQERRISADARIL